MYAPDSCPALHTKKCAYGIFFPYTHLLFSCGLSRTISRVLSRNARMIIYLDRLSPDGSSGLPGGRRAALCLLFGLASDGVYMCPSCYQQGGSLLHCLSTLTWGIPCGLFLLHCPWSHLRQTLSGILPCEARTFLSRVRHGSDHLSYSKRSYHITFSHSCPAVIFPGKTAHCTEKESPVRILYIQAAAADEFTDNGVIGDLFAVHSQKIIQEFKKSLGFVIIR